MKMEKVNKVLGEVVTFLSLLYEGLVIVQKLIEEVAKLF